MKPPFWITTEFAGFQHDVEQEGGNWGKGAWHFFQNKLMPELSTIAELSNNKDYYGTDIAPPDDPNKNPLDNFFEQRKDQLEFALKQNAPFTVQESLKPGSEPQDVLLQMLGVPPAPAWTERSSMENRIIREYLEHDIPAGKRRSVEEQMDARRAYREAIQSGNPAVQEATKAKLQQLGISDKSIRDIEKTANETEAQRLFSHMKAEEQKTFWQEMTPEEKQEFGPFVHKKLKAELRGAGVTP